MEFERVDSAIKGTCTMVSVTLLYMIVLYIKAHTNLPYNALSCMFDKTQLTACKITFKKIVLKRTSA